MLCTQCDTRNESDARFCRVCGATLAAPAPTPRYVLSDEPLTGPTCPGCGRENPAGARFCVFCATALGGSPSPARPGPQPAYAGAPIYAAPTYAAPTYAAPLATLQLANHSHLVLRAVWFVLIGWWLGLLWTLAAWAFNLTLIGLPIGLMMIHRIPMVMTLQPRETLRLYPSAAGPIVLQPVEHPLPLRAIWFVLVGWWASLLWMLTAWAFAATVLLLPISFWMFNRVPTITTLAAEK